MELKITEQRLLIPKKLLRDSQEVDMTQQEEQSIISIKPSSISYLKATEYVLNKNYDLYQRLA